MVLCEESSKVNTLATFYYSGYLLPSCGEVHRRHLSVGKIVVCEESTSVSMLATFYYSGYLLPSCG